MADVTTPSEPAGIEREAGRPDVGDIAVPSEAGEAPVLITEQEVLLATTATQPVRSRWSLVGYVTGLAQRTRARRRSRADRRPPATTASPAGTTSSDRSWVRCGGRSAQFTKPTAGQGRRTLLWGYGGDHGDRVGCLVTHNPVGFGPENHSFLRTAVSNSGGCHGRHDNVGTHRRRSGARARSAGRQALPTVMARALGPQRQVTGLGYE